MHAGWRGAREPEKTSGGMYTVIMTNIEQEKDFVQIRLMVIDSL